MSNFQEEYYIKENIVSTYLMISEFNYTINSLLENIYLKKKKTSTCIFVKAKHY